MALCDQCLQRSHGKIGSSKSAQLRYIIIRYPAIKYPYGGLHFFRWWSCHGEGKDKVQDIINQVISSDLLETSIKGARRLIVNVTMSEDLLISDMDELTAAIADAADDNVEIIFGNGTNPDTKDAMDVTVIAADFVDRDDVPEAAAPKAATTYTANFTQKADDAKADAEAMHKAGVKAADNPNYYDDIFNIFKNK